MTFWDLIDRTFDQVKAPLSPKEIWERANELGIAKDFQTTGKTPWATIGAYLYTDITRAGNHSKYIQISERPAQFLLRSLSDKVDIEKAGERKEKEKVEVEQKERKKYNERDLHPILVSYAQADTHFRAHLKTIFHENSKKGVKGLNEWLHPDLVGVYFPFNEYLKETIDVQKQLSLTSVKIFSFELKVNLNFSNLREYYFQAVSNSSWANEGYLVALKIDDDATLYDEIRRLNNAFGIGLIQLNIKNVYESEILFPARVNPEIDWDTVNRLAKENPMFKDFLRDLSEDVNIGKVKSKYDAILEPEEVEKYIKAKQIS